MSAAALEVADKNVRDYHLQDRVTLIQSDMFEKLPANKRYDLILVNPPYVFFAFSSSPVLVVLLFLLFLLLFIFFCFFLSKKYNH